MRIQQGNVSFKVPSRCLRQEETTSATRAAAISQSQRKHSFRPNSMEMMQYHRRSIDPTLFLFTLLARKSKRMRSSPSKSLPTLLLGGPGDDGHIKQALKNLIPTPCFQERCM